MKELVDEIVRLSIEFGILTEYTAFLAREGTDLRDSDRVMEEAEVLFHDRAMRSRDGLGAVNQSFNMIQKKSQSVLNADNSYFDEEMKEVSITNVQQINDQAYYRRGNRWVDSRLVSSKEEVRPAKVIEFGSEEFMELAERLAMDNRQGSIALGGEILLMVDGEPVLIKMPERVGN